MAEDKKGDSDTVGSEIVIYQTDDGKNYNTIHYNLDMIISLGYRVKSKSATKFRRWATERFKEYMIKCFPNVNGEVKEIF